MAKKNKYEQDAAKKSLLGNIASDLETKGDLKNTGIETVKDLVVGVIGGGLAGAAIGRASLLVGAAVTGIGHYTKSRLASIFGIGMMAASGYTNASKPVNGPQDELEGVKERVIGFRDSFKEKLFLDKIIKSKKTTDEATDGVGEVQYFVYPGSKELEGHMGDVDMSALNKLEAKLADSAEQFTAGKTISGSEDEISGSEDEIGEVFPTDRIL